MKKLIATLAILFFTIGLWTYSALSQRLDCTFNIDGDNVDSVCHVTQVTATLTATLTAVSTNTPESTKTPTPTPTVVLVVTPQLTPVAGASLCPQHFGTQWHSLWNSEQGCHYNHTHNADPWAVADIFGVPGALFGQEIGYPHETPREMELKASGYKYSVGRDIPCQFDFANEVERRKDAYCVRAYRIQYHDHAALDPLIRFHSYFAEVQICTRDGSACWIVRSGGWADFGFLMAPYKVNFIPLDNFPFAPPDLQDEPYRAYNPTRWTDEKGMTVDYLSRFSQPFRNCRDCLFPANAIQNNVSFWATDEPHANNYGYNRVIGFNYWKYDTSILIDPVTKATVQISNGKDRWDDSEVAFYQIAVVIPTQLDSDGDGVVPDWSGWTNIAGEVQSSCTQTSKFCVPLKIEGQGKLGVGFWSNQINLGFPLRVDYDITPIEVDGSWIDAGEH